MLKMTAQSILRVLLQGSFTFVALFGVTHAEVRYAHSDHLGSTSAVTNAAGVVSQVEAYTPFGETVIASPPANGGGRSNLLTDHLFTGQELDRATELYYYGARYYDPTLAHFLNMDPLREGPNPYGYARNNPIRYTDPSGMSSEEEEPSLLDRLTRALEFLSPQQATERAMSGYNMTGPVHPFPEPYGEVPSPDINVINNSSIPSLVSRDQIRVLVRRFAAIKALTPDLKEEPPTPQEQALAQRVGQIWDKTSKGFYLYPYPFSSPPLDASKEVRRDFYDPMSKILEETKGVPFVVGVAGGCSDRELGLSHYFDGRISTYRSKELGPQRAIIVFNADKLPKDYRFGGRRLVPSDRLFDTQRTPVSPAFLQKEER